MDAPSRSLLAQILTTQRVASLGTLRNGFPFVSLVLFAPNANLSAYTIHISRLAHHTKDILADPRVGLMIAEPDNGRKDPQTLARVSFLGEAAELAHDSPDYASAQQAYLARFPEAAGNFRLADFGLFTITVRSARYVADFGKIYNLRPADFQKLLG